MSLAGITILTAENEPDELRFIATALEDNGAEVLRAQNGSLALELARQRKPDLITLDIAMPGVDVTELLDSLRQDPDLAHLKVCVISGRPELRSFLFDRAGGRPDAFLDKPFSKQELVAKVRELLGSE